jgi:hypothetical protein
VSPELLPVDDPLRERLARVSRAGCIDDWLWAPIDALDGERPIDALRRGDRFGIARVVSGLEDPGAV